MCWVYIKSETLLYTAGFYRPDGGWEAESDFANPADAAARVHYLNGGEREPNVKYPVVKPRYLED